MQRQERQMHSCLTHDLPSARRFSTSLLFAVLMIMKSKTMSEELSSHQRTLIAGMFSLPVHDIAQTVLSVPS
jgi:hypothetical protein